MWELRDDIKKNGQIEDITLFQGRVLDGRRRQVCCHALGIEPHYTQFKGTDAEALAFVVSKNLKRRHLGEAERAMIAAKIANLAVGTNQHTRKKEGAPAGAPSIDQAAALMNVSPRAVDRAKAVTERGTPILQDAVKDGTVSLTDAAKVADELPAIQNQAVEQVRVGNATSASEAAKSNGRTPRKQRPARDEKKKVEAAFGVIVRYLDKRGLYGKHKSALEAIRKEISRT
jgi:hypothetical protein